VVPTRIFCAALSRPSTTAVVLAVPDRLLVVIGNQAGSGSGLACARTLLRMIRMPVEPGAHCHLWAAPAMKSTPSAA